MYAQIGMFSLSFHKELFDYYSESVAHMCDTHEECHLLHQHFEGIDAKCGAPNTMDVPLSIQTKWHKWAHTRSMNAGYFLGDSYRWKMGKEVLMDNLMSIVSPLSLRPAKEPPSGLFPQSWPPVDPTEPEPETAPYKILATLVMDDYEHYSTTDFLSPGFPLSAHLGPKQRIRRAGHWLDLSYDHINIALAYAQVLVDEGRVKYQGTVLQRPQKNIDEEYAYVEGAIDEARIQHNYYVENQYANTVHIYPSREVPQTPSPDWEAIANAQPLTGEELEDAVNKRLQEILAPSSAIATPVSTTTAQVTFTGVARRLPADVDEKKDSADDVKLESQPKVSSSTVPIPEFESEPGASSTSVTMPVSAPIPPVPAAVAATPSDDSRKPPEWDGWQTWILRPAPKPVEPDLEPPKPLPASRPYLNERPVIP
eukprot:5633860-Amphidinium_carterae.2